MVKVTGSGFPARTAVAIGFDRYPQPRATVTTDAQGRLAAVVKIPPTAKPGRHTLTASTPRTAAAKPVTASASITVHTNWPMAYGDAGATNSSTTENLLSPADAGNLRMLWTAGDNDARAVTVVDGVVYIVEDKLTKDRQEYGSVIAVNAATGAQLWTNTQIWGITAPPVIGNQLWVLTASEISLLNKFTGDYEGSILAGSGGCTGCLVELNGTVYAVATGGITAIDETTHQIRAQFPGTYGTAFAGGKAFNAATDVAAYDLATGRTVWRHQGPNPQSISAIGGAIAANGLVYVSWGDGSEPGQVIAYRQDTGQQVWSSDLGGGYMTVLGDTVYVALGASDYSPLEALDAHTGKLLWSSSTLINPTFPIYSGGGLVMTLIVQSNQYRLGLINAATGELAATYDAGLVSARGEGNVAIADGRFYYHAWNGTVIALGAA